MQIAFNNCVKKGGEVSTATGPDAQYGLKEGEYREYCWLAGMKKPALGNKKKVKAAKVSKVKAITVAVAVAAAVGGAYVETGGGFTEIDTGLITNARYEEIKSDLIDKHSKNQLSAIELFYGEQETMKEYRAVIDKEVKKGSFKNLDFKGVTQEVLLSKIINNLSTKK